MKKRFILLLVVVMLLVCPIAAALLMFQSEPSRSTATETQPASPTLIIFPSVVPGTVTTGTPSAVEPILATHAAIETQFAGTSTAMAGTPE